MEIKQKISTIYEPFNKKDPSAFPFKISSLASQIKFIQHKKKKEFREIKKGGVPKVNSELVIG